MPFQPGNKHGGRKDKPARDALVMVLKEAGADMPRLRKIMENVVILAEAGEQWAVKEICDRLDGRAHQSIEGSFEETITVNVPWKINQLTSTPLALSSSPSTNGHSGGQSLSATDEQEKPLRQLTN